MIQKVLLDTGPLVAYLNARDRYHEWTVAQLSGMAAPLITCEAVISQSCFVLRNFPVAQQAVFDMIRRGLLVIPFDLVSEAEAVQKLLKRYADVPISVADACLVRMSEQISGSAIFTLDGDFRIYRKHGRQVIPAIIPE
ncbi:MAG: PIN domain-containing protein [Acidobacteriia bacterium]|nr:PIN domain-containing protein [Terriglobia bacterium]